MNVKMILKSIFLTGLLAGCLKEPVPVPPDIPSPCVYDCDTAKFELVWQKPFSIDTSECGSFLKVITEEGVIATKDFCGFNEILSCYNLESGEVKWTWDDPSYIENGSSISTMVRKDQTLLFSTFHHTYSINIRNGITNWENHLNAISDCGWPRIGIFGDWLFHSRIPCHVSPDSTFLVRTKIEENQWDTIFTFYKTNGYTPSFEPPSGWIAPWGDTILIFQNRQYSVRPFDGKVDLYAFNMNADTVLWKIDDLDPHGNSNVRSPLIGDNDKIYFQGGISIYCIDALTGELEWKRQFDGFGQSQLTSNMLKLGGKLIVNPDSEDLFALDAENGDIIWQIKGTGGNCSDMVYHKGYIYFTSAGDGRLHAVKASNGEQVWSEKTPNRKRFSSAHFGYESVAVHPDLDYLYTSDGYFMMCIKTIN